MFEQLQLIALFMPIFIGAGWWFLMHTQDYDSSRNAAMWLILGITLMGVHGQSISIVASNLPLMIALLLLALYNLYHFPKLLESEQHQLSWTNAALSYALLGYQAWFQYGNLWHPYLAQETLTLTIILPIYIIIGLAVFILAIVKISQSYLLQNS